MVPTETPDSSMLTYEFIDPEEAIASPDFAIVEAFLRQAQRKPIGWHYITDILWVYSIAKNWPRTFRILDAGGGSGPLQFLLAEMGFEVTNIDLAHSKPMPMIADRYRLKVERLPSFQPTTYNDFLDSNFAGKNRPIGVKQRLKNWVKANPLHRMLRTKAYAARNDHWRDLAKLTHYPVGKIQWYIGNLCAIPEISDQTFDAVISLSAWEHIPIDVLPSALKEIRRVLKPNAGWAVTIAGTDQPSTWWHDASQCHCYSESDLQNLYGAVAKCTVPPSSILEKYRRSEYLQKNLDDFYRRSGNNGMPWGVWDPKYIPVGLAS
jgi:SAM-dependent methyltransferase